MTLVIQLHVDLFFRLRSECRSILPSCKMTLQKSLFEYPCEVSGSEMNAISWAFYKQNMMDLENGEHIIVPQFLVHRVQDQEELNELVS